VALAADKAKAEKALKDAIAAHDADGVQKACDELIEVGGAEPLGIVLGQAAKADGATYWQLVGAASGFRDKAGLEELGKQIVARQADGKAGLGARPPVRLAEQRLRDRRDPARHGPREGEVRPPAHGADQLALMRCVEAVDALIAALKREEKGDQDLRKRVEQSLLSLIGDDKGDIANWEGWWKNQRPNGVPPRKDGDSGQTGAKPRDRELKRVVETLPPARSSSSPRRTRRRRTTRA